MATIALRGTETKKVVLKTTDGVQKVSCTCCGCPLPEGTVFTFTVSGITSCGCFQINEFSYLFELIAYPSGTMTLGQECSASVYKGEYSAGAGDTGGVCEGPYFITNTKAFYISVTYGLNASNENVFTLSITDESGAFVWFRSEFVPSKDGSILTNQVGSCIQPPDILSEMFIGLTIDSVTISYE
jgi:hypothetical protein